ncbi:hypothetical protein D9M72_457470 [compost metagenome]
MSAPIPELVALTNVPAVFDVHNKSELTVSATAPAHSSFAGAVGGIPIQTSKVVDSAPLSP